MKKTAKRIISLLLTAVMVFGTAPLSGFVGLELPDISGLFAPKAEAVTESYYTYIADEYNMCAEITNVDKSISGDITIPSTLGGYSVTKIRDLAFQNCDSLTSITIPNSVTNIYDNAFANCSSLTSVIFLDGVATIGYGAFQFCNNLVNISIPNSVTTIGELAFAYTGYYNDKNNWENDVLYIDNCLIKANTTINGSYKIKDGTRIIANFTFKLCEGLKNITIPDSVTHIGNGAFYGCNRLKNITIPDSVTYIGAFAFEYCDIMTNITIPDSVTCIGSSAFNYCTSLTDAYYSGSEEEWKAIIIQPNNNCLTDATIHFNCMDASINTILDTFVENRTMWVEESVDGYGTQYGFFDFDNDGVLELVSSTYTGTGHVNFNSYYKFDSTNSKIIKLTNSVFPDGTGSSYNVGFDYSLGTDKNPDYQEHPVCFYALKDRQSGEIFYFATDLIYAGRDGYLEEYGTIKYNNGTIESKYLLGKYFDYQLNNWSDFWYYENGEEKGVSESEFNIRYNNFFKQYDKLSMTSLMSEEISTDMTDAELKETLFYLYNAFSCGTEETEPDKQIAVFSTERSLCVQTGESMFLGFGLMDKDGLFEDTWRKMAVVVSDNSVVSLSNYKDTELGAELEVIGKKPGATNLTVTDTETGLSMTITVNVYDKYVKTFSYPIDDMPKFNPNNHEYKVETNIYNLNGIYVNNYTCTKIDSKYYVEFDAYNKKYHTGAVDIFDNNGEWCGSEPIEKFSDITGIFETGEQAFYLVSNIIALIPGGNDSNLLTYEQESISKKTHIKIEVPEGGYFTISNNIAESPGSFLYNSFDIIYEGVSTVIDLATADSIDLHEFSGLLRKEIFDKPDVKKEFMKIFIEAADNEIRSYTKKLIAGEIDDACCDLSQLVENMFNSLDISWKHLLSSSTGIAESAFEAFSGPAGIAMKGCFAINKSTNRFYQVMDFAKSVDETYVTVYTAIEEGKVYSNGYVVNTHGNIDSEAVLQVFRVSNNNSVEEILDSSNPLEKYEMYNICFVKNDTLVQPNGKVTVYVPIPKGMKGNTCKIYRQEANGNWTVLDAHIEENHLVFETDHFSLYAIVGESGGISLNSLPDKVVYNKGDTLNTSGLILDANGEDVTSGFLCEPTVLSESGRQKITVKYGLSYAEFYVDVKEPVSISITDPSTTTISYGDAITLHAELNTELPEGAYIKWSTNNNSFRIAYYSLDGKSCTIAPENSGDSVITVTVYDVEDNVICSASQTMTSKAGFFQKIIAFFKKLFGLNKTIPQLIRKSL